MSAHTSLPQSVQVDEPALSEVKGSTLSATRINAARTAASKRSQMDRPVRATSPDVHPATTGDQRGHPYGFT